MFHIHSVHSQDRCQILPFRSVQSAILSCIFFGLEHEPSIQNTLDDYASDDESERENREKCHVL
jgi:hypothetical protein